jgi:hypothetical protein
MICNNQVANNQVANNQVAYQYYDELSSDHNVRKLSPSGGELISLQKMDSLLIFLNVMDPSKSFLY